MALLEGMLARNSLVRKLWRELGIGGNLWALGLIGILRVFLILG